MNVPVHGCLDARMTKQLLQHLRLHSALNCSGDVGVAQRMQIPLPHSLPFKLFPMLELLSHHEKEAHATFLL